MFQRRRQDDFIICPVYKNVRKKKTIVIFCASFETFIFGHFSGDFGPELFWFTQICPQAFLKTTTKCMCGGPILCQVLL